MEMKSTTGSFRVSFFIVILFCVREMDDAEEREEETTTTVNKRNYIERFYGRDDGTTETALAA